MNVASCCPQNGMPPVFTGDLTYPDFVDMEDPHVVSASWRLLRERGATRVHPGHGPIREMDTVLA